MGQTREEKIIKQLNGSQQIQKQTPIMTDMFLPNHSGIASHPEFKKEISDLDNTYLKLDGSNANTTINIGSQNFIGNTGTFENIIIDGNSTEAFLIRKNADGGDVFVLDTTNKRFGMNATPDSSHGIKINANQPTSANGEGILVTGGAGSGVTSGSAFTGGVVLLNSGAGGQASSTAPSSGTGGTLIMLAGRGGLNTTNSSSNISTGNGGSFAMSGGAGGEFLGSTSATATGGNGGGFTIQGGTGSDAVFVGGVNNGGDGGLVSIFSGNGGTASGVGGVGGDAGNVTIGAGQGGSGIVGASGGTTGTISFKIAGTTIMDIINDATGTRLNSDRKLYLRDSAIYINSANDGHLDLTADTSIDLNGVVEISGDTYWVGSGSGLPYGHMYAKNTSISVTISAINTAYEITSGITGGNTNLVTFGGNHYLAVSKAGNYEVVYNVSAESTTFLDELECGVMINGTEATTDGGGHGTSFLSQSINMAGSCIVSLSANDQVSLYVRNHTGANNITIEHLNVSIKQLGG